MFAWFDFVMVYIYSISPFLPLLLSLAFIFPCGGSPLSVPHSLLCSAVPPFSMLFFGITFPTLLCHSPLCLTLLSLSVSYSSPSVSLFPLPFLQSSLTPTSSSFPSPSQSSLASHSFPLLHISPALLSASHFLSVSISASQFPFPCPCYFFSRLMLMNVAPHSLQVPHPKRKDSHFRRSFRLLGEYFLFWCVYL